MGLASQARARCTAALLLLVLASLGVAAPVRAGETRVPVDVALDAGNCWADMGAMGGGGLREYEVTQDLARRVRAYLEADGLAVRLTREDDAPLSAMDDPDTTERISREQAARIAAAAPARVYVSIHLNGGPAWLRGTETYYNPDRSPEGPAADYALAAAIQSRVVAALAEAGYDPLDRGAKSDLTAGKPYGHFFSLRGPMPSALLEALFLSNPDEAALLHGDDIREAIARGCAQGILEYLASVGD
jgi:N-acetylmuramoyl-L-alanine amidase